MENIPEKVRQVAKKGFGSNLVFVGEQGEAKYYTDKKSPFPSPTGLPAYIKWDGVEATIISGMEALELNF